jgi:hypothetical protein
MAKKKVKRYFDVRIEADSAGDGVREFMIPENADESQIYQTISDWARDYQSVSYTEVDENGDEIDEY